MNSIILQTATRLLAPLMLVFSLVLLVTGHDAPGGGFVAGLTASSAFLLRAHAGGVASARRSLRFDPRSLAGAGLGLALLGGALPMAMGLPFMTGVWSELQLPGLAPFEIGSPLLFDLGVYLVVTASVLGITFSLLEA